MPGKKSNTKSSKPRGAASAKYSLGRGGAVAIEVDLDVPSGATCRVRRPGPIGLMDAGVLDNIDLLGSIVATEHMDRVDGRQQSEEEMKREILSDPAKLKAAVSMIDKVVLYCVLEPKLLPKPEDGEERDEDAAYIDQIEDEDKMFILQFVMGGQRDVASFRQEFGQALGDLESQQAVQHTSQ